MGAGHAPKRTVKLNLWVQRTDGECKDCGFDALINIKAYEINMTGVRLWLDHTECGRCMAERKRND